MRPTMARLGESIKGVQLDQTTGYGERSLVAAAHGSPARVALKEVRSTLGTRRKPASFTLIDEHSPFFV